MYAYVCENCHLRLLPTKPVRQMALCLRSQETRAFTGRTGYIRNRILNSGQPEAEGFNSSALFQATFCKLARLHRDSARQASASFGVSVALQSRGGALMPVVFVVPELRHGHGHTTPLSEHAHLQVAEILMYEMCQTMGETSPCPGGQGRMLSGSLQGHVITEGLQLKAAARACAFF